MLGSLLAVTKYHHVNGASKRCTSTVWGDTMKTTRTVHQRLRLVPVLAALVGVQMLPGTASAYELYAEGEDTLSFDATAMAAALTSKKSYAVGSQNTAGRKTWQEGYLKYEVLEAIRTACSGAISCRTTNAYNEAQNRPQLT